MSKTIVNYFETITNHMEYLGYEIEDIGEEKGIIAICKCEGKPSFIINFSGKACFFNNRWTGYDIRAVESRDFFKVINSINSEVISKWYYSEDDEHDNLIIVIEADYYGYDKSTFGTFIELLISEITNNYNKLDDFILDDASEK